MSSITQLTPSFWSVCFVSLDEIDSKYLVLSLHGTSPEWFDVQQSAG